MQKIVKLVLLNIIIVVSLTACSSNDHSQQYLMTHPKALKQAFQRCSKAQQSGNKVNSNCRVVFLAANDFNQLVESMQASPFDFGQKILHTEQQLAKAKQALKKQKEQQPAQINAAKQRVKILKQRIAQMLAIVRMTTA